ncbi:MAG TPA: DMT family transporter [Veillonellaceae bacterium]|nr:DMT family transporter [Veillonellaceae bacterium]
MSASAAKWLLASVIVARSSSFLFSKFILVSMDPFELLGLRFLLAFAFLLLVYRKRVMRTFSLDMVRKGAILGVTLASGMAAEMLSLKETDVYLTAFLENMALAIVPLLTMVMARKLPSGKIIASVFIISVGAGFLTLKGGRPDITPGVIYGFLSALGYAFFIVLTARYVKTVDALSVCIWQIGFMGLFSAVCAFSFGSVTMPEGENTILYLLALVFLCSCFGFTFQPVAQKYMSAEDAGLFCALDPLFATLWSMIFLAEDPGTTGFIGAFLVIAGILLAEMPAESVKKVPGKLLLLARGKNR